MRDIESDAAFAEALSDIERDFFQNGDAMDAPPSRDSWTSLDSIELERPRRADTEDDEWEWQIAIARARAPSHH